MLHNLTRWYIPTEFRAWFLTERKLPIKMTTNPDTGCTTESSSSDSSDTEAGADTESAPGERPSSHSEDEPTPPSGSPPSAEVSEDPDTAVVE